MNSTEINKKYPRLARILLAIGMDTDLTHAAHIISAAKHNKASFAHSLVLEAYKLRHQYRKALHASVEFVQEASRSMGAMASQ